MKYHIFFILLLSLSACGDDPTQGDSAPIELELESGAYRPIDGPALEKCADYLRSGYGNADYWIDPDGELVGIDEFISTCNMDDGGFAVFEASPDVAFPYNNTSNTTITFFSDETLEKINALKEVSSVATAESDLDIIFASDTSSGGCGGTPVIADGQMQATTLSLNPGSDDSETIRKFYGSSDNVQITFNTDTNIFEGYQTHSCADVIVDRFGVDDEVIITKIKLLTSSTRAYSRIVSGTYYKILLK